MKRELLAELWIHESHISSAKSNYKTIPNILDPSDKMDLAVLDCFEREKLLS